MYNITAEIREMRQTQEGTSLELYIDTPVPQMLKDRKTSHVLLGVEDGRHITPLQLRKIYATLRDISNHTGYPPDTAKQVMKLEHMERTEDYEYFSLGACSVTKAREFINTLMEYALKEGIILDEYGLKRTDDIDTYLIQCIRYKRCCICGRQADIHHVDAIGMGNNRRKCDDSQNEISTLCRMHHTKAHSVGWDRFSSMYKIYGIRKYRAEVTDE